MASGSVPILPSRILLVDADGLAYYCAGNDDTTPGEARVNLLNKVAAAQRITGAGEVRLLTTASGSHKGHRYAIARVKPYQGQRTNNRRPANWRYLRDLLEAGTIGPPVELTTTAEADDLFAYYAYNFPDDCVIYTQDKDMRMLPGLHLDWVSHRTHRVEYSLNWCRQETRAHNVIPYNSVFNDKQYGPRWFWMQMLHGDNADNIPGLPLARCKYGGGPITPDGKLNKVGEAAAPKILDAHSDLTLAGAVELAYRSYYGERWLVEIIEQACLLWLRRVPDKWDDCLDPGGPLALWNDGSEEFAKAYQEIERRVRDADNINAAAQAQAIGGSSDEGAPRPEPEPTVCIV
jgi:DNA polymerase-1